MSFDATTYKQFIIWHMQQTTANSGAETTTIEDKLSEKTTVLEEIELDLFTGFEDTTALEDKKSLTVFSAIAVVCCTRFDNIIGAQSQKGPKFIVPKLV